MTKLKTLILLLLICGSVTGLVAQADSLEEPPMSSREIIVDLKEGALLIRLATKQNSIDALNSKGRTHQAHQIRLQTRARNLELVEAMKSSFTFCPVYFFYSYDSDFIRNGQIDSVKFLNSELEHDPSIEVKELDIYTAEVTLISQDTSQAQVSIREGEDKDRDNRNESKYYGGTDMSFEALIIKDDQFRQLRKPIPYYARTLNSFFMKRKLSDVAELLNKKLWKFYGK